MMLNIIVQMDEKGINPNGVYLILLDKESF
jgi:hypothetical protein